MDILQLLSIFTSVIAVLGLVSAKELSLSEILADREDVGPHTIISDEPSEAVNVPTLDLSVDSGDDIPLDSLTSFAGDFQKPFDIEELSALSAKEGSDVAVSLGSEAALFGIEESEIFPNVTNGNLTETAVEETTNVSSNLVMCITGKNLGVEPVELVNSTRLLNLLVTESNITNRRLPAECVALLFYARYCPFSGMAAPHFNALTRAFPDIKMAAVDAMKHHSFNTQYGIVGVPTVMLFHNGRPAAKFNDSEYTLELFAKFISKYTGMEPQHKLYVTSADFGGPVPSVPTKETDFCLILSWAFIFICAVYFFSKSSWWHWIVEMVLNTWREAEAQHEHGD